MGEHHSKRDHQKWAKDIVNNPNYKWDAGIDIAKRALNPLSIQKDKGEKS